MSGDFILTPIPKNSRGEDWTFHYAFPIQQLSCILSSESVGQKVRTRNGRIWVVEQWVDGNYFPAKLRLVGRKEALACTKNGLTGRQRWSGAMYTGNGVVSICEE